MVRFSHFDIGASRRHWLLDGPVVTANFATWNGMVLPIPRLLDLRCGHVIDRGCLGHDLALLVEELASGALEILHCETIVVVLAQRVNLVRLLQRFDRLYQLILIFCGRSLKRLRCVRRFWNSLHGIVRGVSTALLSE